MARDPAAVREAARAVLADPEFGGGDRSIWQTILFYVTHPWELVDLAVSWLFERFASTVGASAIFAWGVAITVALVVTVLVVRFGRTAARDHGAALDGPVAGPGISVDDLLRQAERHEAAENWRFAIRARYSALVGVLAEAGVVRRRAGRTTGEYDREVATNAPEAASAFHDATSLFEWVWYGERQPGAADAHRFRDLAADVRRAAS